MIGEVPRSRVHPKKLEIPSTRQVHAVSTSRYDLGMGVLDVGKVGPVLHPKGEAGKKKARLATEMMGISAGTDSAGLLGKDIYQHEDWDAEQQRLRKKPEPEIFIPKFGYMQVATVVGSQIDGLHEGDRVAAKYGNKTGHTLGEDEFFVKIPDYISPEVGVNVAQFGAICANAVAKIDVCERGPREEGEPFGKGVKDRQVLIMGGGPIGVWTAMFMDANGAADVTVVDMSQERVNFLKSIGINAIVNKGEETTDALITQYQKADPKEGPITIDCTGNPFAAEQLFDIAKPSSNIYAMSYYAGDRGVRLNTNFHRKDLSVVDVQVQTQPPGYTRDELTEETFNLLSEPKYYAMAEALVRHKFPLTEAQVAFDAIIKPNDPEAQAALKLYELYPNSPMMQIVMEPDAAVREVIEETLLNAKIVEHSSGLYIVNKEHMPEAEFVLAMADGYRAKMKDGVLKVENKDKEVIFANASGSIELSDGRAISTKDAEISQTEEAIYLDVHGTKDQPAMRVEITADPDHPGLRITQEVTNTTEKEIGINRFVQLDMQEGLAGVSTDEEVASAIGYMSWAKPEHRKVSLLHAKPDSLYHPQVDPLMDGGQVISETVHMQADNGTQVLIGNLSSGERSRHQGIIELHNEQSRIVAWNDVENRVLAPGESRRSEELMVMFDMDRNTGLETHAQEYARRIGFTKEKNEKPYVGVCTWSWAFGKLQPSDVRGAMDKIASLEAHEVPINLMQIDDLGAARHPHGNWVEELDTFLKEEFGGLAGFTDAVHAQDKDAGVWMAPGFVNERSSLHTKIMKDGGKWYVKDKDGNPMVEKHQWEGRTEHQYILDMTHPDVQKHMRAQFKGLADAGVDYIKVDFLYNLILPGQRHRNDLTSVEAYNEFFDLVKDVWGDRKINACGAPFYKTAGQWGIRGGADVLADNAPQWFNPGGKEKLSGGAAQNSVLANFMRLAVLGEMYQRIDPDSTVTRLQGDSKLTPAEVQTIVASNRMGSDALITIGDDPRSIEQEQIELLRLAISGGEAAKPIVFDKGFPTVAMRKNGAGELELSVINWGEFDEEDYEIPTELLPADLQGKDAQVLHVTDLFTKQESLHSGRLSIANVPAHGTGVFTVKAA
jgi:NADPH:quinone reductase-like Zn-dependent oxidoreductase